MFVPSRYVGLEVEVLGEVDDAHAAHRHARGEQGVDVADRQPGVVERALGALGHDLELGLVRRPTGGVLVHPGDGDGTGERHADPLATRPRSRPAPPAARATPRRPAPASVTTRPVGNAAASASAAARASAGSCSPTTTTTGAVIAPIRAGAVPRGERFEVADRRPRIGLHPLAERPLVDLARACPGRSRCVSNCRRARPAVTWRSWSIVAGVGRRRGRRAAAARPPPPASAGHVAGGLERDRGAHAVTEQHRRRRAPAGRRAPWVWAAIASIRPRLSSPPERPWPGRSKAIGRCRVGQGVEHAGEHVARCRRRRAGTARSAPPTAPAGDPAASSARGGGRTSPRRPR